MTITYTSMAITITILSIIIAWCHITRNPVFEKQVGTANYKDIPAIAICFEQTGPISIIDHYDNIKSQSFTKNSQSCTSFKYINRKRYKPIPGHESSLFKAAIILANQFMA